MKQKTKKILKINKSGEPEIIEQRELKKDIKLNPISSLSQASEIGFSIVLPIALGAMFGVWLDDKFTSHPKYTLSFLFVGIILGFANLFYIVKVFSKKDKK